MKNVILILLASILVFGCEKEDASLVNDEGLTNEIVNLIPDSILTIIKDLGMPINGGENPPTMEGIYLVSPLVLKASNIPGDWVGHTFADYTFKLYNQNNSKLTISMDYKNGGESGVGFGSYIVGDEDEFSIFIEMHSTNSRGESALMIQIISGKIASDGIYTLYLANFMLDNKGNLSGTWIDNGQGRLFYDNFAAYVETFKNISGEQNINATIN